MTALLACLFIIASAGTAGATEYVDVGLYGRVELSEVIVLARVIDPAKALVRVERILKGEAPKEIRLVSYIEGFLGAPHRKPLIKDSRELLFLKKDEDAYAPLQTQYGRMVIDGDRLIDSFRSQPRSLSATIASIQRLVKLQSRAARDDREADRAYVDAFKNSDVDVQLWALGTVRERIKNPSPVLADAVLARWPKDAGMVANTIVVWRLHGSAPFFAHALSTSRDGDERSWAAMALGGAGDSSYAPLLRQVATSDAHAQARALAYNGLMWMLGPESFEDLKLGAKDGDEHVRARVVVDSYNLLELRRPDRRWPSASEALIAKVQAFLAEMQSDPSRLVSMNAKSMLSEITRRR